MNVIKDVFPPYEVAIDLEPEELAVSVIECLSIFKEQGNPGMRGWESVRGNNLI